MDEDKDERDIVDIEEKMEESEKVDPNDESNSLKQDKVFLLF